MSVRTQSIQIDPKWLDILRKSAKVAESKPKKIKPCRIKLDGKFLTLDSGKTIWKRKGDAKSAFKNNFSRYAKGGLVYEVETALAPQGNYEKRNEMWRAFVKELEAQGIVEFVEVDE